MNLYERTMPLNTGWVPVRERRLQDWENLNKHVPLHKQGMFAPTGGTQVQALTPPPRGPTCLRGPDHRTSQNGEIGSPQVLVP